MDKRPNATKPIPDKATCEDGMFEMETYNTIAELCHVLRRIRARMRLGEHPNIAQNGKIVKM